MNVHEINLRDLRRIRMADPLLKSRREALVPAIHPSTICRIGGIRVNPTNKLYNDNTSPR
ncbi:hypothetical protein D3C84_1275590 [compost metagenome]